MPTRAKPASTGARKASASPARKKAGQKKERVEAKEGQEEEKEEEKEQVHETEQQKEKVDVEAEVGEKRGPGEDKPQEAEDAPPAKKAKTEGAGAEAKPAEEEEETEEDAKQEPAAGDMYETGVIERGHIYFFYRPKVELEEVQSVDDVQRFHILLVPRPPEFSQPPDTAQAQGNADADEGEGEMQVLSAGADAVPAAETTDSKKKRFRLLSVGKKSLPDPEAGGGKGKGRKGVFWAMVTTVGDSLKRLEEGLGEKEYETKTRGARHQGPARLAARGAYALVNADARTPSQRETHLGYHLSHPAPAHLGAAQRALGIRPASSFVVQVKNPRAPSTGGARVGLPAGRRARFPERIMRGVFGAGVAGGRGRGREGYGLRFASVERAEMLDLEGAELLLIAARAGEEGLEQSLGEGRGEALKETEQSEAKHSIETVLKELAMEAGKIPAEPLEGKWE